MIKWRVNKNLIFTGLQTPNDGEIEIFVNDKPLIYIDLDNFNYDYKTDLKRKFKEICDLIVYELYNGDEMNLMNYCSEEGLREIKAHY